MNLIWLSAVFVLYASTTEAQVCVREGSKCWANDETSRENWCRSNNLNQELHEYVSGSTNCYCCYTCCRTISVVSAIPDYLPAISVKHSRSSSFLTVNSGSSLQLTNFDFYATTVTLKWDSATATHNFTNGVSSATLMVTESNPAWSGKKPPMPSGTKTITSNIPTYFPTVSFVCTLNGTNALTKNNVTNGQSGSYFMSYVSYGSCNLSWGTSRLTFPINGSDLDSHFEIFEEGVIHTSKLPHTGQIWPWIGTKPEIQHVTKTIVSHIPNYFPSFTAKCVINGTITILDTTMLSGSSSTVMKVDVLSTGECDLRWGALTSLTVPLSQDTLTHINVFETHVFLSICPTCTGTRINWPGTRPALPVGRKSIVSHIPSYLPSFKAVCKNNATDLPIKEITSGLTHAYDLDYLSSGNCALTWGTATVSFPVSGKDLTSTYIVDEAKVTYTQKANGTSGASWPWRGSIPEVPVYSKDHVSMIPANLQSVSLRCQWNSTNNVTSVLNGGDSFSYQLDFLSTSLCTATWGNATATWSESGSDRTSRYEFTVKGVVYVSNKMGAKYEIYNWAGATPSYSKTFVSKIAPWYATVKLDCLNYGESSLSNSGTHHITIEVQETASCILLWGEAYMGVEIEGINGEEEFEIFEWGILLSKSPEKKELWKGKMPAVIMEVVSKIENYLPTVDVSCYTTDTTQTHDKSFLRDEKLEFPLSAVGKAYCEAQWESAFSDFEVDGTEGKTTLEIRMSHVIVTSIESGTVGQTFPWSGAVPEARNLIHSHIESFLPNVSIACTNGVGSATIPKNSPFTAYFLLTWNPSCKLQWGSASIDFLLSGADYRAEYDIYDWGLQLTSSSSPDAGTMWYWNGAIPTTTYNYDYYNNHHNNNNAKTNDHN